MGKPVYLWRKLTPKQRDELLAWHKHQGLPWHRPPHRASEKKRYHITAACYEHRPHIGHRSDRMQQFSQTLLDTFAKGQAQVQAWCVLPNHYHALIETPVILAVLAELGRMHGRLSFEWNGEETSRGRQVRCGAAERYMRNDGHFWATLNYVHHNPVHHGYATQWQEWPFSSATEYLGQMGRGFAQEKWKAYPILDYGKGWDDAEL